MRVAIVGNPNAGKSMLFNALTGGHARVANYAGVTVEHAKQAIILDNNTTADIIDLPGCYSLTAHSPDEAITRRILLHGDNNEAAPGVILCVVDATQLARGLYLVLQLIALRKPMVLALNMMDLAEAQHVSIDIATLKAALGIAVIPISVRYKRGLDALLHALSIANMPVPTAEIMPRASHDEHDLITYRYSLVDRICHACITQNKPISNVHLDTWLLHPGFGLVIFFMMMFVFFQTVFLTSQWLIDIIDQYMHALENVLQSTLPASHSSSLLIHGILPGIGSVIRFVPQIGLLCIGIGLLEESGYMARAALLMDKLMRKMGLSGSACIPLLSSFACAVPGIIATRMIANRYERLLTILIAPFMSCSARLPVYTMVISTLFADAASVAGVFSLGGVVMFSMYLLGFIAAIGTAWLLKTFVFPPREPVLLLELPVYRLPSLKYIMRTTYARCQSFVTQTGGMIVAVSIVLWALLSFPNHDPQGSFAGMIGHAIEPLIAPLGFDWRIGIGLIASFAAREVLVSTLAQINSLENQAIHLTPLSGISLMVFFVLAMQCFSTTATVRRETQSWTWPILQLLYMNTLAYVVSLIVFQSGLFMGWGLK